MTFDDAKRIATSAKLAIPIVVSLLVGFEGMTMPARHDRIDPPGVNTVCYGHIENVSVGDTYTKVECEAMLADDIPKYIAQVNACIHVYMPPHRYAAITSFDYNVGGGALCKSSVARYINAGNYKAGCQALLRYTYSNGQYRQGLMNRRVAENKLCLMEN